jgi:hypothetical protein
LVERLEAPLITADRPLARAIVAHLALPTVTP